MALALLQTMLSEAARRGDRFALSTLELVLTRAQRLALGRKIADHDVLGAVHAVREHFELELSLLAQGNSLRGSGADSVIGELAVCRALLAKLTST